jgi:hypothetical protein
LPSLSWEETRLQGGWQREWLRISGGRRAMVRRHQQRTKERG